MPTALDCDESRFGEGGDYGFGELFCGGGAADVFGDVLALAVDGDQGFFDALGGGAFIEIVEHEDCREGEGCGIRKAFAGDVWSCAVDGFEDGAIGADVAAGNYAESADEACGEIAHDIAVEIGEEENVELAGVDDDLHAGVIDDEFLVFGGGIFIGDGAYGFEEEAVGELHDVGFVNGGDALAVIALRVLKGELGNAGGGFFGDDFEAFDDAGNDFVFEAGVEVFGIFADDDDIDAIEAGFDAGKIFDGAKIGVEVEGFAQGDVDAGSAPGDSGGHGAFESDFIFADGFDGGSVEDRAFGGGGIGIFGAGAEFFPFDLDAGGGENLFGGGGDFWTDSFTGEQRDFVGHRSIYFRVRVGWMSKVVGWVVAKDWLERWSFR